MLASATSSVQSPAIPSWPSSGLCPLGRWTAQMFLIFSLVRLDIFLHDDLGIRTNIRDIYGLNDLPDKATSNHIAEPWRPYASIASWYCWRNGDTKP